MRGNAGQLGQLVYDLTGSDMDAGIRCQVWAMKEPDPAEWTNGLFSCPCTRAQAMEDLSFLQDTTDPGSRVKMLRGQRWGGAGGHIFQSILSNRHGSGKRCVYELDGPLLAGYSERFFSGHSLRKHIGTVHTVRDFRLLVKSIIKICIVHVCMYMNIMILSRFVFTPALVES